MFFLFVACRLKVGLNGGTLAAFKQVEEEGRTRPQMIFVVVVPDHVLRAHNTPTSLITFQMLTSQVQLRSNFRVAERS